MKKTILHTALIVILMLLLPTAASGYDFKVDGIYYNVKDGQAEVTSAGNYSYNGVVVIPDRVTHDGITYPVVAIGYQTFIHCSVNKVTIPNSVRTIAAQAFYDCLSLAEVNLPDSLTSIEQYTFSYCHSLTHVTIPNSVKTIGANAFFDCIRLTSVILGDSVTSLGHGAFEHCTALTGITLPNTVTDIGYNAFYGCTELTSFIIPESVTTIEDNTFYGCSGLTRVTIPNSITSIGKWAFRYCSQLDSVTIGSNVTSVGSFVFDGCDQLKDLTCLAATPPYCRDGIFLNYDYYSQVRLHVLPESLEAYQSDLYWGQFTQILGDATGEDTGATDGSGYEFKVDGIYYNVEDGNAVVTNNGLPNCYSGDVVIPDEVTHEGTTYRVIAIGDSAFKNCTALTSIDLGNSIDSIGMYAFQGCTGLTSITIPESVDLIFPYAFGGCTNIKTLIFNPISYFYTILEFADCPLETVIFGEHVQTIPSAIVHNKPLLKNVTIPNSVTTIGCFAFQDCTGLTQVTLPESLITIEGHVFENCTSLTSITIPDAVTDIGDEAFRGCSALSELNFGKSVTSIGSYAFYDCSELTSVYFPNSVTTIGKRAFCNCSKLALVILGSGVTTIGSMMTFGNCWQLKDMICLATTPPSFLVGEWNESSYYLYTTLHVLPESLEAYQSHFGWKEFCKILGDVVIGIPGDVDGDGVITISDANSVIEVIINGGNKGHGHNHAPQRVSSEGIYGDVNGDGVVTIADLNAVIGIILEN